MKQFDTLVAAVNDLKARGCNPDFTLRENCSHCGEPPCSYEPHEFEIDEVHRFEGMTDPADSSMLYAINSHKGKTGVACKRYGVHADTMSARLSNHY